MTLYIAIDWSREKHDVVMTNEKEAELDSFTIGHDLDGFQRLDQRRAQLGVPAAACVVGIESVHNILLDFLWEQGYQQLYLVAPHLPAASRGRYSVNKGHTDQTDARVIVGLLATDRHQLHRWQPDALLTQQIRQQVRWHQQQTQEIVRQSNRLREMLGRYYPAALKLFSDLTTQVTLAFIRQYPHPQEAAALDFAAFAAFARAQGYTAPASLPKQYARFQQPVPQATRETILVYQPLAHLLATNLLALVKQQAASQRRLTRLFRQHPDAPIFLSFPGLGKWLAPALLAQFGDDRDRFPTPMRLQALAGTCPVTDQSGKRRRVKFRHACDKAFRQVAQQWAWCSLTTSVWANSYFQRHQARHLSANDALRRLANRWLAIAWKCWQTHTPYDAAYHWQQCRLRRQPRR